MFAFTLIVMFSRSEAFHKEARNGHGEETTDQGMAVEECSRQLDQQVELESIMVELRDSRVRAWLAVATSGAHEGLASCT